MTRPVEIYITQLKRATQSQPIFNKIQKPNLDTPATLYPVHFPRYNKL